ncbi:MAG TPA: alkaline phosphatase family protein, partial [Chitinophagales bacterium]|nr:alkaline phosphatase family protein [Chitinophagales bacterium]
MKNIFAAFALLSCITLSAQTVAPTPTATARPKLVVGMVVDQMRWDFLYRYQDKYVAGGFKRLLRDGYSCENTHINYSPSYTACGHTCVYTGSVPSVHGITGNNWFDLKENKYVYCTEDTTEKTVGSSSKAGLMSPRRMLTTTITDELRLATNFRSKVIGVALKDRGSILPAGHTANAAYFYDPSAGNWITSTYYMQELPTWVKQFNDYKLPEKYLAENWSTLQPIEKYIESTDDDEQYEGLFENETKAMFTHKVSEIKPTYKILAATPFGNTVTLKFAEGVILNERMGGHDATDFLAVSLSSTDYVGHRFGPNSVETEDC